MTSFTITELKNFMSKLLATECFDSFLLEGAVIYGAAIYQIDGHVNKEFYTAEEWNDPTVRPYDFVTWNSQRPLCFSMIKGSRTPSSFKFVLHLMPEYIPGVLKGADASIKPEQVKALALNIKYDGTAVTIVTGTAFHTFVADKSLDTQWDKTMRQFLSKKGIPYIEK